LRKPHELQGSHETHGPHGPQPLPIEPTLPLVASALRDTGCAVLCAPPGAGKTTGVPIALLAEPWLEGRRIIMLEPRRLAARAAATRMASMLGSEVGRLVGYRMRLDTRVSAGTRIEVVTEGVLTRMLQHDPSLDGVAVVIFDEFHERSIHADTGLALTLQARSVLRPDLRVLVMSATLDADPIARILGDAPVITSEGRSWPVETTWLQQPLQGYADSAAARAALSALDSHDGDVLVFLPGAAEIRRAEAIVREGVTGAVDVYPLHGQLPQAMQDRAIAPSPPGRRKIVLATSIAETSLTIEGVRIVIDSGLMRVPRFSARTGMSRLETMRVARSAADQRRGRAGRTSPGACYRMWTRAEDAGLVPHRAPEILETDLTPLALDLATWGVTDPSELAWLDAPPAAAYAHARELLHDIGAVDDAGAATAHGREINDLGLHPRLAHMLVMARGLGLTGIACDLGALLTERDIFRAEHSRDPDVRARLDALRSHRDSRADDGAIARVRQESAHWKSRLTAGASGEHQASEAPTGPAVSEYAGLLLAFAYPDRIAQRRTDTGRFVMRNGRGAVLDGSTPLASSDFISIATLDDSGRDARIYLAAPIDRIDIEKYFADDIEMTTDIEWNDATESAHAFRTRALGSIVLERVRIGATDPAVGTSLLVAALRRKGIDALPWPDDAIALRRRVAFASAHQPGGWPDLSDERLLETLDEWLFPFAPAAQRLSDLDAGVVRTALAALLTHEQNRSLDSYAPTVFEVPTGSRIPIDYSDISAPALSVRLQELFGLGITPSIAGGTVPLMLRLLSPAMRPVQVTRDLPGFWSGSYFDVRKDLRGRYPKHEWPLDPLRAQPTRRAKRRDP
jgi:ATP-dependent helicase HrpB